MAVYIDSIKNRKNNLVDINATIYCEKNNHKGIIIGEKGNMLKKISTFSRKDIETILNKRVNLKIWVKVKKDWQNKENILRELGYIE